MSDNDAIMNYPYGTFLMDRLDLILLRDDELQARIMRIIEHEMVKLKAKWQDDKLKAIEKKKPIPPEPEYYWVTLSYAQIIAYLYKFDSAKAPKDKKNTISRSTLRKAINALIDDQYLLRKAKPGSEFGAAQYTLNTKLIEEHMWSRLPKDPWSYLGYNGNVPGEKLVPPQAQNLNPPPSKNVPGEAQNLNLPLTNFETGELQNLRLLIDREIELRNTDTKDESKKGAQELEAPSRSSTHSQSPSQEKSSSEKNSKEEVEFSPEEQAIYDFGKETIFKAKPPKKTQYVKGQCAEIAKKGIKTLDHFKSLATLAKQETGFKTLHLGNLINALNGWLFMQQFNESPPPQSPTSKASAAPSSYSYDNDEFEDDTFYSVREVKNREEVHAAH
jgi:gamma-glutamylcyclotransferase (GGCT)/AIG2-like uncharacterized protein YtfP